MRHVCMCMRGGYVGAWVCEYGHYKWFGFETVSIHSYMCESLPTHIQCHRFLVIYRLFSPDSDKNTGNTHECGGMRGAGTLAHMFARYIAVLFGFSQPKNRSP